MPRHKCAAVLALVLAVPAPGADWPQFLGPARNGTTSETGLTFTWPAAAPSRAWSYRLGAGWSGPVVVGDRVFIFHRVEDDTCLDCLRAADGHRLWRYQEPTDYRDQFRFDEGPRATP